MATSKALGIVYRFQANRGRSSPVCHPYSGMVGKTLAQGLLWEKRCVGLGPSRCHNGKLKSYLVLIKVIALGNRGCNTEETPPSSSDRTLASLTLGLPSHTSHALGGHLGKGLERLKPLVWYHQEDSLGNPTWKRGSWAKKSHQTFLLAWGMTYIFILMTTKLRITIMTVEPQWCANHSFTGISFSHYTNSSR